MQTKEEAFEEYQRLKAEMEEQASEPAEEVEKVEEVAETAEEVVAETEVSEELTEVAEVAEVAEAAEVEEVVEEQSQDPLAKKEKEELIRIIKDQQKWDAKRGTELGELRKAKAEYEAAIARAPVPELSEEEAEEAEYVEKIVENVLKRKEAETEAQKRDRELQNYHRNRQAWEKLEEQPELFALLENSLNEEFTKLGKTQEERSEVLFKDPDWVERHIYDHITGSLTAKEAARQKVDNETSSVEKRKKSAATADGRTAPPKAKMTKATNEMSKAEYEEYLKENFPQVFKKR
jgi:hypothetical protein